MLAHRSSKRYACPSVTPRAHCFSSCRVISTGIKASPLHVFRICLFNLRSRLIPRAHRLALPLRHPILQTTNLHRKSSTSTLHHPRNQMVFHQHAINIQRRKSMDRQLRVLDRVNRGQVQAWTPLISRHHPKSAADRTQMRAEVAVKRTACWISTANPEA